MIGKKSTKSSPIIRKLPLRDSISRQATQKNFITQRTYANHTAKKSKPTLSVHKERPAEVEEIFNTARHPSINEEKGGELRLQFQEAEACFTVRISFCFLDQNNSWSHCLS